MKKLALLTCLSLVALGLFVFKIGNKEVSALGPCGYTVCEKVDISNAEYEFRGPDAIVGNFNGEVVTFRLSSTSPHRKYTHTNGKFCERGTINVRNNFWNESPKTPGSNVRVELDMYYPGGGKCVDAKSPSKRIPWNDAAGSGSSTGTSSGSGSSSGSTAGKGPCDKGSFFTFPTWYKYLDLGPNCDPLKFKFPQDILPVALALIDMLLRLVGLVAILAVILAGVGYMTASGDVQKTATARQRIYNAFIGLIVASIAAAVVAFIGNRLG